MGIIGKMKMGDRKQHGRMPTIREKYWTDSGRGDRQDIMELEDNQSYLRHYMTGKTRG